MTTLKTLIADNPDPVFILNSSGEIVEVNSALDALPIQLEGKYFDDVVQEVDVPGTARKIVFNDNWYELNQRPFTWESKNYIKVVLKDQGIVPDMEHLQKMRDMIATFLHRMRSPLTAMYGYAELLEDNNRSEDLPYLQKLLNGFDQLFKLMEELEELHTVSFDNENLNPDYSSKTWDVIINDLLYTYGPGVRNRIQIKGNTAMPMQWDSKILSRILSILITNAVEHTAANQEPVVIEIQHPNSIKITNGGQPIPDKIINNLFCPFVTTKADNLGIGLTKAILLARQIGANIFLTGNTAADGISFTLFQLPS